MGYVGGKRQSSDITNAVSANEFNQRLTSLRVMRENKVPAQTIESLEISAVNLLDTITLDGPGEYSAAYVLKESAQRLAKYVRDFPSSEFADRRHTKVSQLLASVNH